MMNRTADDDRKLMPKMRKIAILHELLTLRLYMYTPIFVSTLRHPVAEFVGVGWRQRMVDCKQHGYTVELSIGIVS